MAHTTTTLEFSLRKSTTRLATLLVAAATSATLLLGMAAPAQAASNSASSLPTPPDCFKIVIPGVLNLNVDCRTRDAYQNILRLTNKAIAAKSPKTRLGYLNYMMAAVAGPAVVSKKGKKVRLGTPTDQYLYEEVFDSIGGAPSNSAIRCYRNTVLKNVILSTNYQSSVDNFNSIVNVLADARSAKKGVKREYDFIKAAGDRKAMLKFLGKQVKGKVLPPMLEFYIKMAKDSGAYVKKESSRLLLEGTMLSMINDCTNVPEEPKYVTKSTTQTFNGTDLISNSGNIIGSVDSYDSDRRGYCNPVGTKLACKSYDNLNSLNGPDNALRLNSYFDMPEEVKQAVPGSLVTMQLTTNFADIQGKVGWEYGEYSHDPKASGTNYFNGVQSQTLGVAEFNGRTLPNLDYFMRSNSTMVIDNVKVTYTYTIKQ